MESNDEFMGSRLQVLQIDEIAKDHLRESAKWAKFLSIVGFVMIALIVLSSLSMFIGVLSSFADFPIYGGYGALMTSGFLMMGLIYFYPVWKMYQFSNFAKNAIHTNDSQMLTNALGAQKSIYTFMGIVTIVLLCFYALLILGLIIGMGSLER